MYTIPPKKMIIINILDILKKYTDMDHRLTQAEIVDILKKEYCMVVDRKTVKRNLLNLLDLDCGIDYTEIIRTDEKGNDTSICTDWYIQREFTDAELRLLIDSLLFSKNTPYKQCKELIEKLKCIATVNVNKQAFFCWAMQYGLHIEVLEPADMRERVKDATKYMWEKYKGENL